MSSAEKLLIESLTTYQKCLLKGILTIPALDNEDHAGKRSSKGQRKALSIVKTLLKELA